MSGIAKIYDTTVVPSKEEIVKKWIRSFTLLGSYRLVDTQDEEVGIEVLVGRDLDERLIQVPFTYRSAELDPVQTLSEIDHGVLGKRWASNALGDPVAVREFIRTILTGDDGAAFDDGTKPILDIHGTGKETDLSLDDVQLTEVTRQVAVGTVRVNGAQRRFKLRMPQVLAGWKKTGRGHSATQLRLTAADPDNADRELLVAEFSWLE